MAIRVTEYPRLIMFTDDVEADEDRRKTEETRKNEEEAWKKALEASKKIMEARKKAAGATKRTQEATRNAQEVRKRKTQEGQSDSVSAPYTSKRIAPISLPYQNVAETRPYRQTFRIRQDVKYDPSVHPFPIVCCAYGNSRLSLSSYFVIILSPAISCAVQVSLDMKLKSNTFCNQSSVGESVIGEGNLNHL